MSDQWNARGATSQKRFATLALITAFFTYALIVFGGVVRITGSGMGCGDDWPLCNGQLIPPMDFETLIEYGHRLAALLVTVLVFAVAAYALRRRRDPGIAGRGIVALAVTAAVLLVVQVFVGAVTVWLELPTGSVVLHLGLASALLAVLIVAGLRATAPPGPVRRDAGVTYPAWTYAAAAVGFLLLFLGALVANTGAAPLCRGFPLCNGLLIPKGGGLVHLHWTHRLVAYAEVVVIVVAAVLARRQAAPRAVQWAGAVSVVLVAAQVWVAAAMVLGGLTQSFRALHLAVGVALWAALVVWAVLTWQAPPVQTRASVA
jgi:heme A synthase